MKIEHGPSLQPDSSTVLTVGTFDGVHVGHQSILRYLCERASKQGGVASVLTFDPHPRTFLTGQQTPLLTTIEERAALLAANGVERLIILPFTAALANMEAEAYVRDVLVGHIGLQEIVVGYDHAFGKGRAGNTALLESMSDSLGFTVDQIPAAQVENAIVSSTRIRHALIEDGAVGEAARLLGRPFHLAGTVIEGDQRGRLLGYPTANLDVTAEKLIPLNGVYAVRVQYGDAWFGGMLNIGVRPTFEADGRRVEVHLFDFDANLYGEVLRLEFVKRIRDERKFGSVDALVVQLEKDQTRCIEELASVS